MFLEYGWPLLLTTHYSPSSSPEAFVSLILSVTEPGSQDSLLRAEEKQPNSKALSQTGNLHFSFMSAYGKAMLTIVAHIHGGNSIISCHCVYKLLKPWTGKRRSKAIEGEIGKDPVRGDGTESPSVVWCRPCRPKIIVFLTLLIFSADDISIWVQCV